MSSRARNVIRLVLAIALLIGASFAQNSLNVDRERLGLTRVEPLDNAPPVLAFTTVALGGFRGIISNLLWMRASDLQDDDKFFEMAQLADWITKLEPHYVQVWLVQAWNMAYNISVKFKDYPDRWRWVQRGIELLRDDGLRYNPNETLIFRELAWFFQHKMGQNLDDASLHYKQMWANEMAVVFDKRPPDLDELINPKTEDAKKRAALLRDKYKMDPVKMKAVDEEYGPLEWRLPEAHAIYWAIQGLDAAKRNPGKIKKDDLITLRRVVYQSMQLSFQRGRLVTNVLAKSFEFGPNLAIIPRTSFAYEQAAEEDQQNRDHILTAHRNFLRDAVYFLYENNQQAEARKWYDYLAKKYPNKTVLDGDTNSLPARVTYDDYCARRIQEDISETSRDRVESAIEGMLQNSYAALVMGDDNRFAGFQLLARQIWKIYMDKMTAERTDATRLNPLENIDKTVVARMLDPKSGMPAEARAILRTRKGLPAEVETPPPADTPAPTPNPSTNAPPEKAGGK
jgi:hypothetical protein